MAQNSSKFWKLGKKELSTEFFSMNKKGELIITEGAHKYNVHHLAEKFGTSMEIYLPSVLSSRLDNLFNTVSKISKKYEYNGKFSYHFPMKVNQNKEYISAMIDAGADLEVSSSNELTLLKKLLDKKHLYSKIDLLCNGPKTQEYSRLIHKLFATGLNIIPIIENADELDFFKKFKGSLGIRINLESKVRSHWDKKIDRFGLTSAEILEIGKINNLKILHYHIGSQIMSEKDFILAVTEAFQTYKKLRKINPTLDTINIGGGYAIPYEKKKFYSLEPLVKSMIKKMKSLSEREGIPHPNWIVEWGRYITAPSQITVYKVVSHKDISKGIAKQWYIIDGSFMNDLLDTWAIHQKWHIVPVNHMNTKRQRVWLAGMSCDSDDKYTDKDGYVLLPKVSDLGKDEDLYLAVFDTGAYQDAFSSHHCLLSSPIKVVLQDGVASVARKRESAEVVGKMFGW